MSVTDCFPLMTDCCQSVSDCSQCVTDMKPSVTDFSQSVTDCLPSVSDCSPSVTDTKPFVTDCSQSEVKFPGFWTGHRTKMRRSGTLRSHRLVYRYRQTMLLPDRKQSKYIFLAACSFSKMVKEAGMAKSSATTANVSNSAFVGSKLWEQSKV